jgi:hypothetical protein
MLCRVIRWKITEVSEVLTASIIRVQRRSLVEIDRRFRGAYEALTLMMEAVRTSEISMKLYQTTQHNIPEDGHLHVHHCENLRAHLVIDLFGNINCR